MTPQTRNWGIPSTHSGCMSYEYVKVSNIYIFKRDTCNLAAFSRHRTRNDPTSVSGRRSGWVPRRLDFGFDYLMAATYDVHTYK